jgi:hypothetical protein
MHSRHKAVATVESLSVFMVRVFYSYYCA